MIGSPIVLLYKLSLYIFQILNKIHIKYARKLTATKTVQINDMVNFINNSKVINIYTTGK